MPQIDPACPARRGVGLAAGPQRLQRRGVGSDVVVRLAEVLDHHLPVPGVVEGEAVANLQARQPRGIERRRQWRQRRLQRRRLTRQADEHPAAPLGQGVARQVAAREVGAVHERRGGESPVQPVGPQVIGTADHLGARLALDQRHAAVPADVGERGESPLAVAGDEHRLGGDHDRLLRAGTGQLVHPTDRRPAACQRPAQLTLETRRGVVIGGRQRRRAAVDCSHGVCLSRIPERGGRRPASKPRAGRRGSQPLQPGEDGDLQGDAMVAPAVVGGHVLLAHPGPTLGPDRGDQGVGVGGEAVVRGQRQVGGSPRDRPPRRSSDIVLR